MPVGGADRVTCVKVSPGGGHFDTPVAYRHDPPLRA